MVVPVLLRIWCWFPGCDSPGLWWPWLDLAPSVKPCSSAIAAEAGFLATFCIKYLAFRTCLLLHLLGFDPVVVGCIGLTVDLS